MEPDDEPVQRSWTKRLTVILAWAALVPWALFLIVRLVAIDSDAALVAIIGLTPYVGAASLLPVLLASSLRLWPAAIAAVAITAVFAVLILPRTFGGPTEATPEGPALRVLAANMMLGAGSVADLTDLVEELEPDVVSIEELTPALAHRLDELGFGAELHHTELLPDEGSHGSGLYSRFRLEDPHEADVLRAFPFLTGTVRVPGAQPVEVSSVHTVPPTSTGWAQDLDAVPAPPEGNRAVLLGDFNATLDHAPFREVLDRGWKDAAATVGAGLVPTWPTDRDLVPPLYAIDHVLVGDAIGVRDFSVHDISGTDHRAVFAELQIPAG